MKKLFYIVLVIVILLVIGRFIKQEAAVPTQEEEIVTISEQANTEVLNDGEVAAEETENVVEANPEATATEDETVVKE